MHNHICYLIYRKIPINTKLTPIVHYYQNLIVETIQNLFTAFETEQDEMIHVFYNNVNKSIAIVKSSLGKKGCRCHSFTVVET